MKHRNLLLLAIFFSGAAALIYEVTWTRPISHVYQSTVYIYSIILTAYMFGLGLGSALAGRVADRLRRPLFTYALIEIGIGLYGLVLLYIFPILPYVYEVLLQIRSPLRYQIIESISIFLLLLIPTTLMGATFPLLASGYIKKDVRRGISLIYGFNNIGAIAGTIVAGFWLVPSLGVHGTIGIAAALNLLSAGIALLPNTRDMRRVLPVSALLYAVLLLPAEYNMERLYSGAILGFGDYQFLGSRKVLYYEEGLYGSVAVISEGPYGEINRLLLNGQGSSSLRLSDVRVSQLLGYLPVILNKNTDKSAVIGFGTGSTSAILARHGSVQTLELEPKVLETARFFESINDGVLRNPNHTVISADARHHLLTTREVYDVIVNHPLDPFQSFSSLLFTSEFVELAKQRLATSGLYVQWIPTYALGPEDLKKQLTTLSGSFPHCVAFTNLAAGENIAFTAGESNRVAREEVILQTGEEIIVGCSEVPITSDVEAISRGFRRLDSKDHAFLATTSLNSPERFARLRLFALDELAEYIGNAMPLTDDHPRLEFTVPYNLIQRQNPGWRSAMADLAAFLRRKNMFK